MSLTAKRGEFRISEQAAPRSVAAFPRRRASTFSPSAALSRLRVTDSGRRYDVRLFNRVGETDPVHVQIRAADDNWEFLTPLEGEAFALSFQSHRTGVPIKSIAFDMIAASRGRILAKEKGTDRFFHVILDPLFRTIRVPNAVGIGVTQAPDGGDPWVPSNYIKLDPEFFAAPDGNGFPIPPSLLLDYSRHPAAERFRVVTMQMRAEASDMMAVPVTPRTWHLIDSRSPLKIVDLADLNCIGDDEVRKVVTKRRITRILEIFYADNRDAIVEAVIAFISEGISSQLPNPPGFGAAIRNPLEAAADNVRAINRLVADIRGRIGSVFGLLDLILDATGNISAALDDLDSAIRAKIADVQHDAATVVVGFVADLVVPALIDWVAETVRGNVADEEHGGFAALLAPLWIVAGLVTWKLQGDGVVQVVPALAPEPGTVVRIPIDVDALLDNLRDPNVSRPGPGRFVLPLPRPSCSARTELAIDLGRAMKLLDENDNAALRDLVDDFVAATRERRGVTIPNAPPDGLPVFTDVVYQRASTMIPPGLVPGFRQPPETHERRAIAFSGVMDLGVGTVHWHEHWQNSFGGEMHSIFARRPMFQQEQFGLALYRFLNGPVIDGDGWQDGTTNFYILVKLDHPKPKPGEVVPPRRRDYAVLFIDEQTYFTQRWRLVHPRKDTAGDVFSLASQLGANPEYFRFDIGHYWDPFEDGSIHGESRMAVQRQIIAVTGRNAAGVDEIYTFCFAWGMSDRTWRWRRLPATRAAVTQETIADGGALPRAARATSYPMTLAMREDATLHVRGWRSIDGQLAAGRYFQKYLPADCRHAPMAHELTRQKPERGFDHPWHFVAERAFQSMDRFYQLGAYEAEVDARCQYYELDILPDASGRTPPAEVLTERTWYNGEAGGQAHAPLRIDTINVNWDLPPEGELLRVSGATEDNSHRPSLSRYESITAFRIRERRPNGFIAVFRDKRDDDLQAASHLPHFTELYSITSPLMEWRTVRVAVRANHRLTRPPVVQKVAVERVRAGNATTGLRIRFWTSLDPTEVAASLWRISLAGLESNGSVTTMFREQVHGRFARQAAPGAPLALNYSAADVIDHADREYACTISNLDAAALAVIDRLCTPLGRATHGTSVWFEDIVGHLATPDAIEFRIAN